MINTCHSGNFGLNKCVFLVMLLLSAYVHSQNSNIIVLDAYTYAPIDSGNIFNGHKVIGKIINGTAPKSILEDYEVFEIRAHGYQLKICSDLRDSIFLQPYNLGLGVVNVEANRISNAKQNSLKVGYHKSGKFWSTMRVFGNCSRIAVLIPNEYECNMQIREINLALRNDKSWDYEVSLISVDSNGLPDEVIYSDYIQAKDRVNSDRITVTDSTVIFPPEGVVVSTLAKRHIKDQFEIRNGLLYRSGQDQREGLKHGLNVLLSEEYEQDRMYLMTMSGWVKSSALRPPGVKNKTPRFGLTVSPCVQ